MRFHNGRAKRARDGASTWDWQMGEDDTRIQLCIVLQYCTNLNFGRITLHQVVLYGVGSRVIACSEAISRCFFNMKLNIAATVH